jgi:predicted Ser/Thr protein kinase
MPSLAPTNWPSARQFAEAIQCPGICFNNPHLRDTLPAVDRLGMPLVTSGQFAYVYKLKLSNGGAFAVRCFRGHLGDREHRYQLIDEHLRRNRIPALAGFAYEPQGILVGGRRFPVLAMEWVEGPTLDVYLDEVVSRKEVLLHLADEWLRLMQSLNEAGVAHGDLQHGNIIVERGQLRLVDLDGMFVPAMKNLSACEMGHQHYQHPSRDARLFNASLDNFSALVVYLSLVALAERPELWIEHHDENLIFTKADFLAPAESVLFRKIKEIGPECRRLAEVLEAAALGNPLAVPSLFELVSRKGKLPSWMVAPPDIEITGRTREATPKEIAALKAGTPQWTPWQSKNATRPLPSSPKSNTVQSVFSTPAAGQGTTPAGYPPPDPSNIGENAFRYTKELIVKMAWIWWVTFVFLRWLPSVLLGIDEISAGILTVILILLVMFLYGLGRALVDFYDARQLGSSATGQAALPPGAASTANQLPFWLWNTRVPSTQAPPPPTIRAARTPPPAQPAATALNAPYVGSRVLAIYHVPSCEWALKISRQNCVDFNSTREAQAAGYQPCWICKP